MSRRARRRAHPQPAPARRGQRWAALLFFALPSAAAVWFMAAWLAFTGAAGDFSDAGYKVFVVMLPVIAALGLAGAWQLQRRWVLGSTAGLAVGALLAIQQTPLAVWYAMTAGLMYLTTRKL